MNVDRNKLQLACEKQFGFEERKSIISSTHNHQEIQCDFLKSNNGTMTVYITFAQSVTFANALHQLCQSWFLFYKTKAKKGVAQPLVIAIDTEQFMSVDNVTKRRRIDRQKRFANHEKEENEIEKEKNVYGSPPVYNTTTSRSFCFLASSRLN